MALVLQDIVTTPGAADDAPTGAAAINANNAAIVAAVDPMREALTANRTYYVRTDGSDSNDGLTNSSGGAFLTPQKAVDTIRHDIDTKEFGVTIKLADGTYPAFYINTVPIGEGSTAAKLTIEGNVSTPANVKISAWLRRSAVCTFTGVTFVGDTAVIPTAFAGVGLTVGEHAECAVSVSCAVGAAADTQFYCYDYGRIRVQENYEITGGGANHFYGSEHSALSFRSGRTVTISGTPAFSSSFVALIGWAQANFSDATFTGSATGKRYDAVDHCAVSSANTLPGSVAGTLAAYALYNGAP